MVSLLLFIALSNLVLGYFLGAILLRPLPGQEMLLVSGVPVVNGSISVSIQHKANEASPASEEATETTAPAPSKNSALPAKVPQGWNTACLDIRHDIAAVRDRISYALQANDKKINKELAFELQTRTPAWQQLLHDKLTALTAELERDPAAKVDCSAPELCLAQIETLQSNLKLLDWSESSESILKKLEREVELVKNLVPRGM